MFTSAPIFFSVYVPLVLIAAFSIIFEEKFVAFEQRLKKAVIKKLRRSSKRRKVENRPSASASAKMNRKNERRPERFTRAA